MPLKLLPMPLVTLSHSNEFVQCIGELKDGTLLTGYYDKTIKRWTKDGSSLIREYIGVEGILLSLFQLDEDRFVSGTELMIYVWSICDGSCITSFNSQRAMCVIGLKKDRNLVVSSSWDHSIRFWRVDTKECIQQLTGHTGPVEDICELSNNTLASGSWDTTVIIWDIRHFQILKTLTQCGLVEQVIELHENVVVVFGTAEVMVWKLEEEECFDSITVESVPSLCRLNDSSFVMGIGCQLKGWSVSQSSSSDSINNSHKKHLFSLRTSSPIYSILLLKDGSLATTLANGSVEIWKMSTRYGRFIHQSYTQYSLTPLRYLLNSLVDLCCIYLASTLSTREVNEDLKEVLPDELQQLVSSIHKKENNNQNCL